MNIDAILSTIAPADVITAPQHASQFVEVLASLPAAEQVAALRRLEHICCQVLHNAAFLLSPDPDVPGQDLAPRLCRIALLQETSEEVFHALCRLHTRFVGFAGITRSSAHSIFNSIAVAGCSEVVLTRGLELLDLLVASPLNSVPYFYFSGKGAGLNIHPGQPYPFTKGFSCGFWLRLEPRLTSSRLFVFHCEGVGGVECHFDRNRLFYRQVPSEYAPADTQSPGLFVHSFIYEQWTFVTIEHERHRFRKDVLKITVNGEETYTYLLKFRVMQHAVVSYAGIGYDFLGQISRALFFAEPIGTKKYQQLYEGYYTQWLERNELEEVEAKTKDNFWQLLCMFWHPCRSNNKDVYDCAGNFFGSLSEVSGAKTVPQQCIEAVGGIPALLPILPTISFNHTAPAELLERWLKLLATWMAACDQRALYSTRIFKAVAELLALFPASIFTLNHIEVVEQLLTRLDPVLKAQLVVDLLWEFDLWENTNQAVLAQLVRLLAHLYIQDFNEHFEEVNAQVIMQVLAEFLIRKPELNTEVSDTYIFILEGMLLGKGKAAETDLPELIRILFTRPPAPLLTRLLLLLSRLLEHGFSLSYKGFTKTFAKEKGLELLLDLISTSTSAQIRALCIKSLGLVFQACKKVPVLGTKREILSFVSASLLPSSQNVLTLLQESSTDGSELDHLPIHTPVTEVKYSEANYIELLSKLVNVPPEEMPLANIQQLSIQNTAVLPELIEVLSQSSIEVQRRATMDLMGLTNGSSENAVVLAKNLQWHEWLLTLLLGVPSDSDEATTFFQAGLGMHTLVLKQAISLDDNAWICIKHCLDWIDDKLGDENAHKLIHMVFEEFTECIRGKLKESDIYKPSILWKNIMIGGYLVEEYLLTYAITSPTYKRCWFEKLEADSVSLAESFFKPVEVIRSLTSKHQNLSRSILTHIRIVAADHWTQYIAWNESAKVFREENARCRRKELSHMIKKVSEWTGPWCTDHPTSFELSSKMDCEMAQPLMKPESFMSQIRRQADRVAIPDRPLNLPARLFASSIDLKEEEEDNEPKLPSLISEVDCPLAALLSNAILTVEVAWIFKLTARYGVLQLVVNEGQKLLRFVYDPRVRSQFRPGMELFEYSPKNDRPAVKTFDLTALECVIPKTYVTRHTAVEFYFTTGHSVLINFLSKEDRQLFCGGVSKLNKAAVPRLGLFKKPNPKALVVLWDMTRRWREWEISNFEYLMFLNKVSGRSYYDLAQYPVFPWVLIDYTSSQLHFDNPGIYRDFTKNVGSQGSAERLAKYKKRFQDFFGPDEEPYHFGSHYSNPGIVLHFLTRVLPFAEGAKELQGGKFDLPDRLFRSLASALQLAKEDTADVRELIPEFFSSPTLLLNKNKLELGVTQTGKTVDDVELPPWAPNAYEFIRLNRIALESNYVSSQLHHWIDLIFGYKQKGPAAVEHMNVFHPMTYDNAIDLDKVEDPNLRRSYETQAIYFGKTPSQLFAAEHPQKKLRHEVQPYFTILCPQANLETYQLEATEAPPFKTTPHSYSEFCKRGVLHLVLTEQSSQVSLIRLNGSVEKYFWWPTATVETDRIFTWTWKEAAKVKVQSMLDWEDNTLTSLQAPVLVLKNAKCIVKGGFWSGAILIQERQGLVSKQKWVKEHSATVTCLIADPLETLAISGAKNGSVCVWTIEKVGWRMKWKYFDHQDVVTAAAVCKELLLFATCSLDGSCMLYSLNSGRLHRVLEAPGNSPLNNIAFGPVAPASLLLFCSAQQILLSYSVTGDLLSYKATESVHLLSPLVIRDLLYQEFLLYGTELGYISLRNSKTLEEYRQLQVDGPIVSIVITADHRFLFAGSANGSVSVILDPKTAVLQTTKTPREHPSLESFL